MSARLRARVNRDFPDPGSASEVLRIVEAAAESERIQAAIVLSASGDMSEIRNAANLARLDWRDVLVNGGLADEGWPTVLKVELGP